MIQFFREISWGAALALALTMTASTHRPRVLVLQGDRRATAQWRSSLRRHGFDPRFTATVERAFRTLARDAWDAFVVDLDACPDGLGVMSAVRGCERTSTIPIVAVTASTDEAIAQLVQGRGCDRLLAGETRDSLATELETILVRAAAA